MTRLSFLSWLQLILSLMLAVVLAGLLATGSRAEQADRIVSVGGSVTEIVYALGQQHRLVARDTTSNHPDAALGLPDVGYVRRLSPEGVLSVSPDMILAEEGAGPPETLDLLRETAVPVVTIPMGFDRTAVSAKIIAVAEALGLPDEGRALAASVDADIVAAAATDGLAGKRVLFILTMQGGRVLAGGANTAAQGILTLVGAENAARGFAGYKLLTDEAILTAAPDVILLMEATGDRVVSDDDLFGHPAIAATPAGQSRAVLRMDGMLLLGFSVRTGEALQSLASGLTRTGT